ncbi:hypothetical protein [Microvirga lotononidis]|uniref:Uncharacterized protein n=1 Tax=Microvirga lotononidis TaxID=864069 RepID=I4YP65_9HYPH|nr:hypothetical protein [Microvirga lotononidis]EIM25757.1 hypothetical protein MicloDRAFT_00064840 [Microvirga lotononidis]WQO25685.1 hypothetical protein U0023_13255 [Microvirga lotononidis]
MAQATNIIAFPKAPANRFNVRQELDPRAQKVVAEINELIRHLASVAESIDSRMKLLSEEQRMGA